MRPRERVTAAVLVSGAWVALSVACWWWLASGAVEVTWHGR